MVANDAITDGAASSSPARRRSLVAHYAHREPFAALPPSCRRYGACNSYAFCIRRRGRHVRAGSHRSGASQHASALVASVDMPKHLQRSEYTWILWTMRGVEKYLLSVFSSDGWRRTLERAGQMEQRRALLCISSSPLINCAGGGAAHLRTTGCALPTLLHMARGFTAPPW